MSPSLQPPQKDFFVSYNQADRVWAKWIAWHLEENGYTVILQAWDFFAGGNFVLAMHEAAQQARRTIAVLSPDYLNAPFPQAEWAAAFVQDPASKDRKLIPVRVLDCKPQGVLAAIGYIDLVNLDEQAALAKLLQGVKGERAKPTSAPGFPGSAPSAASSHLASGSSTPPSFPHNSPASSPLEIFIINAEEDETFRKEIEKRLRRREREGEITIWHMGKLQLGIVSQQEIDTHFYKAKLILLLVSPDFLDSQDCQMLMQEAMKRTKTNAARVIPIIMRSCDWEDSPFSILVTIPRNKKPVSLWSNKDAAYLEITKEIRDVLPNP